MGVYMRELSNYSQIEFLQAFDGLVEAPEVLQWKDIESFWAR